MKPDTLKEKGIFPEEWEFIRTNSPRLLDGYVLKDFYSESYRLKVEGIECSLAKFYLRDEEVYRAWGATEKEHCSYNSIKLANGAMSESLDSCPRVHVDPQRLMLIVRGLEQTVTYPITILETVDKAKSI